MRIIYCLTLCCSLLAFSQKVTLADKKSKEILPAFNVPYESNTLILRVKPGYAHLLKSNSLSSLSGSQVKIESLNKVFPDVAPPTKQFNARGEALVDLSLIYKLRYTGKLTVPQAVAEFSKSDMFEYVEPAYEEAIHTLYQPNDPAAQPGVGQFFLIRHKFIEAFDITQGDTNVVIGVIDTGTELTHIDLKDNIKYNYADPINGIDDDGDGYLDNFHGWDLGTGTAVLGSGDNNPNWAVNINAPAFYEDAHGVMVQGGCSSTPDNNIHVCGGGFKCKAMPIKIANNSGGLSYGYDAIVYAANHGCKVINCSWGVLNFKTNLEQDKITYAAINKDVVIVASAGNSDVEGSFYPASYKHVLSVSGLDTQYVAARNEIIEKRTYYGPGAGVTYGFDVDISAHLGAGTTTPQDGIGAFAGTSFSSPIVAGAAGLIRSKYPNMKAVQVAELLRVSGSCLDSFPETWDMSKYKMGRMLNVEKALNNIYSPSIRLTNVKLPAAYPNIYSGDTIELEIGIENLLSKANNLQIRLHNINNRVTMIDSVITVGFIDSLQTIASVSNKFKFVLKPNNNPNLLVDLVFFFSDPSKNYYDHQGTRFAMNPNYLEMDTNQVAMTIFANGNIGYNDDSYPKKVGKGFVYPSGPSMLFAGGLMIGLSDLAVSDCVRGLNSSGDSDFKITNTIGYVNNSSKDLEVRSLFNDSISSSPVIGLSIEQVAYAEKNAPKDKQVVIQYNITNNSSNHYDSLYVGMFADWDINVYNYNRADYDAATKTAYTFDVQGGGKYAGITVLSGQEVSSSAFQYPAAGGVDIYNDGFNTEEKYLTMSGSIGQVKAGQSGFGSEVSQLIAAKVRNLAPGQTQMVAFAIIAGDNLTDMKGQASSAHDYFGSLNTGTTPSISGITICKKDTVDVTISPSGATTYGFYADSEKSTLLSTGASHVLSEVTKADTIYITNKDMMFESATVPFIITEDQMEAAFIMFPDDTLDLDANNTVYALNQSTPYSSLEWSDGQGNTLTGTNPSFVYSSIGLYDISLTVNSPLGCEDVLTRTLVVTRTTSTDEAGFNSVRVFPNPISGKDQLTIETTVPLEVIVTNVLGEQVLKTSIADNQKIDIESWSPGYYHVLLRNGERVRNMSLIKQ